MNIISKNCDNSKHFSKSSFFHSATYANTSHNNHLNIAARQHFAVSADRVCDSASSLGTITKFNSNFSHKKNKISAKRQSARAANFKLTDTAKNLLANTAQKRVCVCMSHRVSVPVVKRTMNLP